MNLRDLVDDRRRLTLVLAAIATAVGVALLVVGLVRPSGDTAEVPAAQPSASASPSPSASPKREAGKPPERLVVESIDLDAPLRPIEVDPEGVLTPPSDVSEVGWWQRSALPGAPQGQTIVTGHAVNSGDGVMDDLGKVRRGDVVKVHDDDQVFDYSVTKIHTLTREEVAEQAESLFMQDRGDGRLVLITCEDFVNGVYTSNTIVFAEPLEGTKKTTAASNAAA
ncbi:MAG: class F sortase [Nocardioides sp.]|nr:class F sortase [Nocardioides sp.]